jgi:membrane protein implicated in regulation of membrane protease activity
MRDVLAPLGIGALAIACCGLAPIVLGALAGVALAPLLGLAVALILAVALVAALTWQRHRRSCAVRPEARR